MKILISILMLTFNLWAQAEYVDINNKVYDFLDRMNYLKLLKDYNSFELPKTRKEIAKHILNLTSLENKLDEPDRKFLEDLKVEFEYELWNTLDNSEILISCHGYHFLSDKEKYLFAFVEKSKLSLFVNLITEPELIAHKNNFKDDFSYASLINLGGELRGTIMDKFGFYLRGTNGISFGNKNNALLKPELRYNFKFNENSEERFYDETQSYIAADFDFINLKLARDRINVGHGTNKFLFGNNAPLFDYVSLNLQHDFFSFSFMHGKLLGKQSYINDTVSGDYFSVQEKYFAYHRLGFNINPFIKIALGEVAVYGDRAIDLSYLVPFSFFKSVEHSNRDRDNTMLFFDITSNVIPNSKLFCTFLIDDIDFGKIGSGWWGNQTLFNLGIHSSPFYKLLPADIKLEYLRIEPYTYTHRLIKNNFTNFGYSLASYLQPNSELFFLSISYRFNNRLLCEVDLSYVNHGANRINNDGTIINFGGDINLGHRKFDSEFVKFLEGELQTSRSITTKIFYEPFNQLSFFLNTSYYSHSNNNFLPNKEYQVFLGTNIKF